jgi:glyoxylate reductase/D-3-phosphoglycerate dehydrogenase
VDVESARKAKVPVANNGGANAIAVAEHTIMLMLAVQKRLVRFHNDVVAGKWRAGNPDESRIYELAGKTLGIVGLGNIGKKVARRAAAFDMAVQYYDIVRLTEDREDALGVRFALLTEILSTSDVVTLHVPLLAETRHMIGVRELKLMKDGATLINTARGSICEPVALEAELVRGRLSAVLDTTEPEELPASSPLFSLPNVLLTPHIAGSLGAETQRLADCIVEEVERFCRGQALRYAVRHDELPRLA